jgi:hypothetical protein
MSRVNQHGLLYQLRYTWLALLNTASLATGTGLLLLVIVFERRPLYGIALTILALLAFLLFSVFFRMFLPLWKLEMKTTVNYFKRLYKNGNNDKKP